MSTRPRADSKAGAATCRIAIKTIEDTTALFDELRRFARRHGIPVRIRRAMHVALDEVVTNVLRYATTATDPPLELTVTLAARNGLQATVIDNGPPFNPLIAPEPRLDQPLVERPIGGLGILLVKRLVDRVRYARRADRNHLVLTMRMPAGAPRA